MLESELAEREAQTSPAYGIDVIDGVLAYVDSEPAAAAAFGQMWIDNTRGGIHVAFTDHTATHEAALRQRLPADAMPNVVQVAISVLELDAEARRRLAERFDISVFCPQEGALDVPADA